MTRFEEYCQRKRQEYGEKFVPPTGRTFIEAYNAGSQYRVKVQTTYGSEVRTRWGYVGLTTGWQPCFLLMRNVQAHGSSDTLNPDRDIVIESRWLTRRAA